MSNTTDNDTDVSKHAIHNTPSSSTQILSSMHMDYVHHIAFDMYGRRMATCSGDRFVRIWDLNSDQDTVTGNSATTNTSTSTSTTTNNNNDNNDWVLSAEWQAHRGSVSQLAWAHAEFGPLVATCGSDTDVKLWEEGMNKRWVQKAVLPEARRTVTSCEFAPRQWGLKLATGSADGVLRIYEAVDVMNLAQWPLQATLSVFPNSTLVGVTCLSWSTTRFEPPTLVVGGGGGAMDGTNANGHPLVVYRYLQQAWQPILTLGDTLNSKSDPATTTTNDGGRHVLDVAWAPNVGRRHHWIAAAYGKQLCLYKLLRSADNTSTLELASSQVLSLSDDDSDATIWRCQWNVTGTVLATSGDAGVVQLWKSDFDGNFKCVSQIHGDLSPPEASVGGVKDATQRRK